MEDINLNHLNTGYVKFTGKDELPAWAITHYLEQFCINHMKLVIIQRICELATEGIPDSCFSVVARSAEIFPHKSFRQTNYLNTIGYYDREQLSNKLILTENEYTQHETKSIVERVRHQYSIEENISDSSVISAQKGQNADYFWHIITNFRRPIVLINSQGSQKPLYDFNSEEAAKIWSLKVQSPVEGIIKGAVGAAIDLVYAGEREERQREDHMNRQVGQVANNIESIVRASQCIHNPATPEGVKRYAESTLNLLMRKQAILNERIGITDIHIDVQR